MISVSEAVERRMSVRRFLSTPVQKDVLLDILDRARRAPSGGNVQPWRVHAVTGAALEALVRSVSDQIAAGKLEEPEYEIYPRTLWEPHRSYRFKTGEDMYGLVGIAREDRAARLQHFAGNYRFFGAPVGMFFSLDQRFGPPQWSDVGMLMQTIMLLAVERGLDTCAQECWSLWPGTVKAHLGLGDESLLFSGMALGYRDADAPINQLRTDRAPTEAFVSLHGFD